MFKHEKTTAGIYPVKQNNHKVIKSTRKISVDRLLVWPIDCFDLNTLRAFVRDDYEIPSLLSFPVS